MNEELTIELLFKMMCALNFIHKANVIHRDLKPGNILVSTSCEVFLCDFGLARTQPKIEKLTKDYTRENMAKKLYEL